MCWLQIVQAERYFGSDCLCWSKKFALFGTLRTQISNIIVFDNDCLYVNIFGYCFMTYLFICKFFSFLFRVVIVTDCKYRGSLLGWTQSMKLTLIYTHTPTLSPFLSLTHTLTHTRTQTHTHTNTHTLTHTQTHTHSAVLLCNTDCPVAQISTLNPQHSKEMTSFPA